MIKFVLSIYIICYNIWSSFQKWGDNPAGDSDNFEVNEVFSWIRQSDWCDIVIGLLTCRTSRAYIRHSTPEAIILPLCSCSCSLPASGGGLYVIFFSFPKRETSWSEGDFRIFMIFELFFVQPTTIDAVLR